VFAVPGAIIMYLKFAMS